MTVVIAAPDAVGEAVARVLEDRDVIHVTSAEAAHRELRDATVVVVGDATGPTTRLRRDARASGAAVVDLADVESGGKAPTGSGNGTGPGDGIDSAIPESALREAVARAEYLARYRQAVDDFFEACRDRAEGRQHPDVRRARTLASRRFQELHEAVGYTPYGAVCGDRAGDDRAGDDRAGDDRAGDDRAGERTTDGAENRADDRDSQGEQADRRR